MENGHERHQLSPPSSSLMVETTKPKKPIKNKRNHPLRKLWVCRVVNGCEKEDVRWRWGHEIDPRSAWEGLLAARWSAWQDSRSWEERDEVVRARGRHEKGIFIEGQNGNDKREMDFYCWVKLSSLLLPIPLLSRIILSISFKYITYIFLLYTLMSLLQQGHLYTIYFLIIYNI